MGTRYGVDWRVIGNANANGGSFSTATACYCISKAIRPYIASCGRIGDGAITIENSGTVQWCTDNSSCSGWAFKIICTRAIGASEWVKGNRCSATSGDAVSHNIRYCRHINRKRIWRGVKPAKAVLHAKSKITIVSTVGIRGRRKY